MIESHWLVKSDKLAEKKLTDKMKKRRVFPARQPESNQTAPANPIIQSSSPQLYARNKMLATPISKKYIYWQQFRVFTITHMPSSGTTRGCVSVLRLLMLMELFPCLFGAKWRIRRRHTCAKQQLRHVGMHCRKYSRILLPAVVFLTAWRISMVCYQVSTNRCLEYAFCVELFMTFNWCVSVTRVCVVFFFFKLFDLHHGGEVSSKLRMISGKSQRKSLFVKG